MNWSDPIVDEVRRVRDGYAAQFQYDLRAIVRDLQAKEKLSGRPVVRFVECGETNEKTTKSNDVSLSSSCAEMTTERTVPSGSAPTPPAASAGG